MLKLTDIGPSKFRASVSLLYVNNHMEKKKKKVSVIMEAKNLKLTPIFEGSLFPNLQKKKIQKKSLLPGEMTTSQC